eukprot:TRINITY_DN10673_c0_g2_i2.p2 TRINITY_DN10673_c0_g2~~TRINITY_DN10673_c0_g2_i2.p2  ORF type:complete len:118 (+),score=0.77 TRINITY_DN10673_c0_g2_i2:12-365(+)
MGIKHAGLLLLLVLVGGLFDEGDPSNGDGAICAKKKVFSFLCCATPPAIGWLQSCKTNSKPQKCTTVIMFLYSSPSRISASFFFSYTCHVMPPSRGAKRKIMPVFGTFPVLGPELVS